MFTTPEFIAADSEYRRERISAAYNPSPHHRALRQRRWRVPFARSPGRSGS